MATIAAQAAGVGMYWAIQKKFRLSTKTMMLVTTFWIATITGWGLIGVWSTKFGFHNVWECTCPVESSNVVWALQVYAGFLTNPFYAYVQT